MKNSSQERERDRETERDRQTDRQTDRQIQTERQIDRERDRDRDRDRQTDRANTLVIACPTSNDNHAEVGASCTGYDEYQSMTRICYCQRVSLYMYYTD